MVLRVLLILHSSHSVAQRLLLPVLLPVVRRSTVGTLRELVERLGQLHRTSTANPPRTLPVLLSLTM